MKALAGFRELYPEEALRRGVIQSTWRKVAKNYGFEEYDGPTLEPLELYSKKNAGGEEILGQLYRFEDGGGRQVALRPEMTPSLARMAASREKHYRKPMKWFAIGNFFRFERQQRGRLREFIQLNCDLLGDASPGADAELVAFAIDAMRAFGLRAEDFVVRISHRGAWASYLAGKGIAPDRIPAVLQIADKLEREAPEVLEEKLHAVGLGLSELKAFIHGPPPPELHPVIESLAARGLADFVEVDLSIVRGLAYYTGLVFEIFDRSKNLRALAGGGRYDGLVAGLSEGAVDLPAVGFGMGDVVLGNFLGEVPHAEALMQIRLAEARASEVYVIVADETRRPEALKTVQDLRNAGLATEFSLSPSKVGKQFQAAGQAHAKFAVLVGSEWPAVKVKVMSTRAESEVPHGELAQWLKTQQV
ncbi:MAG: histidine--tRNA ligase [Terrimicrobiaceae bacterium]